MQNVIWLHFLQPLHIMHFHQRRKREEQKRMMEHTKCKDRFSLSQSHVILEVVNARNIHVVRFLIYFCLTNLRAWRSSLKNGHKPQSQTHFLITLCSRKINYLDVTVVYKASLYCRPINSCYFLCSKYSIKYGTISSIDIIKHDFNWLIYLGQSCMKETTKPILIRGESNVDHGYG